MVSTTHLFKFDENKLNEHNNKKNIKNRIIITITITKITVIILIKKKRPSRRIK